MRALLAAVAAVLAALLVPGGALAASAPEAWPPEDLPGWTYVHYAEEHWNDEDGERLLKVIVSDVVNFRPDLVVMAGDKANNGVPAELEPWKTIMAPYEKAGIPYYAGVGNHDRAQVTGENQLTEECGGCTPIGDLANYREVFKDRPYPMGDAPPLQRTGFGPATRPADDPAGASSHYYLDAGPVRWIFIDSSCYGIVNCDPLQSPPDGAGLSQYDFLRKHAADAKQAGKLVFIVTHMPTRDLSDQSYRKEARQSHTMGKGTSPDNDELERVAEAIKADALFFGHIKAVFQYRGRGDIPYFIDGGSGGDLYTTGPRGVDHGYWHAYRMVHVDGGRFTTDVVPVLTPGSITIKGPEILDIGESVVWEAFGEQPIEVGVKVDALELRDPNPTPKSGLMAAGVAHVLLWVGPPLALLLLAIALGTRGAPLTAPGRRRMVPRAAAAGFVAALGMTSLAAAQQSEPTSTTVDQLPNPARIWTTGDQRILAPVASSSDDPRRDTRTQTADGRFRAVCPGATTLSVTTGHVTATTRPVTVPSAPGAIARTLRRGPSRVRRGRTVRVLRANFAQPGVLRVKIKRGTKTVQTLVNDCVTGGLKTVSWRAPKRAGRYVVEVRVISDRAPRVKRYKLRVR